MGTHLFRVWGWAGLALGLSVTSASFASDKSCGEGTWLRVVTTGYDVQLEPAAEKNADDCYKVAPGQYTVKFLQGGVVKGTVGALAVVNRTKVVRFKK